MATKDLTQITLSDGTPVGQLFSEYIGFAGQKETEIENARDGEANLLAKQNAQDDLTADAQAAATDAQDAADAAQSGATQALNENDVQDALISGITGGAGISNQQLKLWANTENFRVPSSSFDADGYLETPVAIVWPDSSAGTLTISSRDSNGAVLSLSLSHAASLKTLSKTLVRNSEGFVTSNPDWSIS